MNLDLHAKFWPFLSCIPRAICRCIELLALFQQQKLLYTVKQRCILSTRGYFNKLTKAYTPCNTFLLISHAYPIQFCIGYELESCVHTINSPMLFCSYCIVVPFVKAGRGSASAVSTMQRLVKGGKCSLAGVCNPLACEGLQTFYKHGDHPAKACEVWWRFWKHTQRLMKTASGS